MFLIKVLIIHIEVNIIESILCKIKFMEYKFYFITKVYTWFVF
uniref:Uncharacterized protein n=1 Tax=viral metagenome TaxID=1070528 RepID=A0A6C0JCB7_9ZZZZ